MMQQLIENFSPTTILLCCIGIFLTVKSIIEYKHWIDNENEKWFQDRKTEEDKEETIMELIHSHNKEIIELNESMQDIKTSIKELTENLLLLTDSDKDSIKAYITNEFHEYVEHKGWIDDFTMDCIERRFSHYKEEGGNSFIADMVEQLRELPRSYEDRINK